jgi:hypothetical protein
MKIVWEIHVKMEQYVLIQKKVLLVFVHHGKKIVRDVSLYKKKINRIVVDFSIIYSLSGWM